MNPLLLRRRWMVQDAEVDYSKRYLTIVSLANDNEIKFLTSDGNNTRSIDVSTDGRTWETKTSSKAGTTLATLDNGEKLFVRGETSSYSNGSYYHSFVTTGNFVLEGNIMSMLYGDNFEEQTALPSGYTHTFFALFRNCRRLVNTDNLVLPATTLVSYCYRYMFYGCSLLTNAPELPATTLAAYCYGYMFRGCTSLTTAPALNATTLVSYCYEYMFYSCTALNYIKCLATNISATRSTDNWVSGVAASGTFVTDANMTSWTTGNNGIPSGWTRINA